MRAGCIKFMRLVLRLLLRVQLRRLLRRRHLLGRIHRLLHPLLLLLHVLQR